MPESSRIAPSISLVFALNHGHFVDILLVSTSSPFHTAVLEVELTGAAVASTKLGWVALLFLPGRLLVDKIWGYQKQGIECFCTGS